MAEIALVTGGNTGIGFEIVRSLAQRGMTVYLGSRDPAKGEAAAAELKTAGDVRPVRIEMDDDATMTAALDRIEQAHGRLDILVNNAGASLSGNVFEIDPETVRESFETNLHGPMRLLQLAVPLLRKSDAGRVVNVSSSAGRFEFVKGGPGMPAGRLPYAYCVAKAALNAATVMWAAALEPEGIKVNACCPGHVKSQVSRFMGTRTPAEGARIAVELATIGPDGPTGGFFNDKGAISW